MEDRSGIGGMIPSRFNRSPSSIRSDMRKRGSRGGMAGRGRRTSNLFGAPPRLGSCIHARPSVAEVLVPQSPSMLPWVWQSSKPAPLLVGWEVIWSTRGVQQVDTLDFPSHGFQSSGPMAAVSQLSEFQQTLPQSAINHPATLPTTGPLATTQGTRPNIGGLPLNSLLPGSNLLQGSCPQTRESGPIFGARPSCSHLGTTRLLGGGFLRLPVPHPSGKSQKNPQCRSELALPRYTPVAKAFFPVLNHPLPQSVAMAPPPV